MLKKLLKGCLTVALVSAMAIPAMADAKITGRVRVTAYQKSVKDGASYLDFKSDSRLGATMDKEMGAWKATGRVELALDNDSEPDAMSWRHTWVGLENETMSIKLGNQYPFGIAKVGDYCLWHVCTSYWAGEGFYAADFMDVLTVSLKDVGLDVVLGLNNIDTSATDDAHNETTIAAIYNKQFGAVDLALSYISQSQAIDEKQADASKDYDYDGGSNSNLALAVGYAINDKMDVAFNYDSIANKTGGTASVQTTTSSMELWFDMGLDDVSGISFGYGTYSTKTDAVTDKNATAKTAMSLAYGTEIGGANVSAGYNATTEKDDDTATDKSSSTLGVTLQFGF